MDIPKLEDIKEIAIPACDEFGVKRLDLFGSLAMGVGRSDSDLDLLVEFDNPDLHASKRFFGLLHYLEDAFDREIDLLTTNTLKNPYFRDKVLEQRITIYER